MDIERQLKDISDYFRDQKDLLILVSKKLLTVDRIMHRYGIKPCEKTENDGAVYNLKHTEAMGIAWVLYFTPAIELEVTLTFGKLQSEQLGGIQIQFHAGSNRWYARVYKKETKGGQEALLLAKELDMLPERIEIKDESRALALINSLAGYFINHA